MALAAGATNEALEELALALAGTHVRMGVDYDARRLAQRLSELTLVELKNATAAHRAELEQLVSLP